MPNFTAGENMCISQLIQGINLADAKEQVIEVMKDLAPHGNLRQKNYRTFWWTAAKVRFCVSSDFSIRSTLWRRADR